MRKEQIMLKNTSNTYCTINLGFHVSIMCLEVRSHKGVLILCCASSGEEAIRFSCSLLLVAMFNEQLLNCTKGSSNNLGSTAELWLCDAMASATKNNKKGLTDT